MSNLTVAIISTIVAIPLIFAVLWVIYRIDIWLNKKSKRSEIQYEIEGRFIDWSFQDKDNKPAP